MEPVLKPPSLSFILIFVSRSKNQLAPLYTFQNWNPSLLICIIHDVTRCRPFGRDRSFTLDASIHAILNLTGFAILAPLIDEEKIARRGPISRRPLIIRDTLQVYTFRLNANYPHTSTPRFHAHELSRYTPACTRFILGTRMFLLAILLFVVFDRHSISM